MKDHEIDHVYLCGLDAMKINGIVPNPAERHEIKWVTVSELDEWVTERPNEFTSWFKEAYKLIKDIIVS